MQTWDAITSRRNVRSFADRPIPAADLDRILEAGRRSPSSQNWQPPFRRAQLDLGQATMAMMLGAADLGIGSCHAGIADLPRVRELLGIPGDRDWALLISLGYPAGRPLAPIKNPDRRPFDDVVHRGRW
jgi:nitroreductase